MKKQLLFKTFISLLFIVIFESHSFCAKQIVYVYDPAKIDNNTGVNPDVAVMDYLAEQGYEVVHFAAYNLSSASAEQLDSLENADLVIIGRAIGSTNFQSPNKELWHAISAPILTQNMWALRSNRMNWFNTESCSNVDDSIGMIFTADILEPSDPVFAGMSGTVDWWNGPYSTIDVTEAGNGTVLASKTDGGSVLFVRFEAGFEFYSGGDTPYGERVFIGSASDNKVGNNGNNIFNYLGYPDPIKQVFLNEIARLTGSVTSVDIYETKSNLTIYPNPAINNLYVEMKNLNKIEILDISGKHISTFMTNEGKSNVNLSNMSTGLYFIKASDINGRIIFKKFIKE